MNLWNKCEAKFREKTLKASDRDKTLILIQEFLPDLQQDQMLEPNDKKEFWLGQLLVFFQADLINA
jgi:hypothetical protein